MSLKGVSETSLQDRLAKYVEEGEISTEAYTKLIEKYGAIPSGEKPHREIQVPQKTSKNKEWSKNKIKTIVCATLCIILALLLTSAAIVYHNYATEKAFDKGYGYYKNVKDEYKFFNKYAVIVTTTGKKYHRYNCYHINGKELHIYNTANAEAKGYTACPDCISQTALEKLDKKYGLTQRVRKE